jgi:hypothetical protein
MGSLSDSLQIKGFYRTQSIATASGKITISSTRIKTILVMTEKEIRKGPGNQSAGQILEMHKREAGAEPSPASTTGKPSGDTHNFMGVSEEKKSSARLGRHMQGK